MTERTTAEIKSSCTCDHCRHGCHSRRPGDFLPGELERVAEYLNMTVEEVFRRYIGVDYFLPGHGEGDWAEVVEPVYALAPALVQMEAGTEYPFHPIGQCIFYTAEGLCGIHRVKPYECREGWHGALTKEISDIRHTVMRAWKTPQGQQQIRELLGREPNQKMTILDMLRVIDFACLEEEERSRR